MKKRKKEKKENVIYLNFKLGLENIRKEKKYVWLAFFIFMLIALIGFFFPVLFVDKVRALIQELILKTEGLGGLELTQFIIANNMASSFIAMISGIFLMIPSFAIIIVNGYVIGFVANKSVAVGGPLILWRLVPHGIFEIPAILISVGLGIKIGFSLMHNCIQQYNKKMHPANKTLLIILSLLIFPLAFLGYLIITLVHASLRRNFSQTIVMAFRTFIFVVIPLLVIAGIIEGILIALVG